MFRHLTSPELMHGSLITVALAFYACRKNIYKEGFVSENCKQLKAFFAQRNQVSLMGPSLWLTGIRVASFPCDTTAQIECNIGEDSSCALWDKTYVRVRGGKVKIKSTRCSN